MDSTFLALAPAVPTAFKVGISVLMFVSAFGLATSIGKRKIGKPILAVVFLGLSAATVVALDLYFPDTISPGLDGRGVLAALIGLAVGAMAVPWATRSPIEKNPS